MFRKLKPIKQLILGSIIVAMVSMSANDPVLAQNTSSNSSNSGDNRNPRAIIVQPKWGAADFATPTQFEHWMRNQLEQAQTKMVLGRPNLVILTELNGVGLLL